jgi:hypothetical protein
MTKIKDSSSVVLKDIQIGDLFSERSYYIYAGKNSENQMTFTNPMTPEVKPIAIGDNYVSKFFNPAEQYTNEVTVGKLDKVWTQGQIDKAVAKGDQAPGDYKAGDMKQRGIRAIWDSIGDQCFTVIFQKKDSTKTKKALAIELAAQRQTVLDAVAAAKKSKKSMTKAIEDQLEIVQNNPITNVTPGAMRILKGWKLQHTSIDGRYACHCIEEDAQRSVNINTIAHLIVGGTRYNVK